MARLRAITKASGGTFDPNKLEAAYAFDLIRHGFLLRQKLEDYKQPSVLVVNPMWQHLLTDDDVRTEPDTKQATLVAHGQSSGSMTIEPVDGNTAQEIALALSQRHAQIVGLEIVAPHVPPMEGHTVIARIVGDWYGVQPSTPVWTVVR